MTVRQAVSSLREILKKYTDDTFYTSEYLFTILGGVRSELIKQYLENPKNKVNKWNYATYCVELEEDVAHDCACVEFGCKVLKSVNEIPKPIGSDVKVHTLGYNLIEDTEPESQRFNVLHPIRKKYPYYSVMNDRLIIWNNLNLKSVLITAIWEDETDWVGVALCDKSVEDNNSCLEDPQDLEFRIPDELFNKCLNKALRTLIPSLQINKDVSNDSQPQAVASSLQR